MASSHLATDELTAITNNTWLLILWAATALAILTTGLIKSAAGRRQQQWWKQTRAGQTPNGATEYSAANETLRTALVPAVIAIGTGFASIAVSTSYIQIGFSLFWALYAVYTVIHMRNHRDAISSAAYLRGRP